MRPLDVATFATVPWKNGGGMTTVALVLPAGATMETFELRVSMARVDADGPFSELRGIDRTLVVTEGAGLTLDLADGSSVTLDRSSPPFSFTGEDPVSAALVAGPVTDLNVMSRRSLLRHRAERVTLRPGEARTLVAAGELTLLAVLDGGVTASAGEGETFRLDRGALLTVTPADGQVTVEVVGPEPPKPASVLLVDFLRR